MDRLGKTVQSAFFSLYLLLKETSCGETEAFILIAMDLCYVLGSLPILVSHTEGQYCCCCLPSETMEDGVTPIFQIFFTELQFHHIRPGVVGTF